MVLSFLSLGALAQLVARFVRNEEVRGSNPLCSTSVKSRDIVPRCRETFLCFWRGGVSGHRSGLCGDVSGHRSAGVSRHRSGLVGGCGLFGLVVVGRVDGVFGDDFTGCFVDDDGVVGVDEDDDGRAGVCSADA